MLCVYTSLRWVCSCICVYFSNYSWYSCHYGFQCWCSGVWLFLLWEGDIGGVSLFPLRQYCSQTVSLYLLGMFFFLSYLWKLYRVNSERLLHLFVPVSPTILLQCCFLLFVLVLSFLASKDLLLQICLFFLMVYETYLFDNIIKSHRTISTG